MGTANGQSPADLKQRLLKNGPQFEFFQALRLLSRLPGTLRIRPDLSLGFPVSDVTRIEERPKDQGFSITTTFMGLYGASSPIPAFYTEDLFRDESPAARDFLDIFHQRLYALLFEGWKKNRLFIQAAEAGNAALEMLYALCGISAQGVEAGDSREAYRWVRYAGLLGGRPRSALGLETLLTDVLGGERVEIVPFIARAVKIPQDQQLYLGSENCALGQTSFIGKEFTDRQGKFRVRVGPLSRARFRSLLQGGKEHAPLVEVITRYLTDPLDYDIELLMEGKEVEPACLGAATGSHLGLDTALFTGEFPGRLNVLFPPAQKERIAA